MNRVFAWLSGIAAALLTFACGPVPGTYAQTTQTTVTVEPGANGHWISGSPAQTRVLVGDDGQTYVGVWVEAPERVARPTRAPMAVALLVDTSGSMSGAKINNARMAASSFLETLRNGDIVSVFGFSDGVTELAAPTVISAASRGALMRSIQNLYPAGGTNMYQGLASAQARLSQAPPSHSVRRLILISDGRANVGPSDPGSLGNLAGRGTEWGIQVSSIGVGLDYDENTLGALAVRSAGRVYHLQQPQQMASILRQEMNLLAQTVATNAVIEIFPKPGVSFLGVESLGAELRNGCVRVQLGSLHAGQRKEVLIRANLSTQGLGRRELATARLQFQSLSRRRPEVQEVALRYEVVDSEARARNSDNAEVLAMVATQQAVQAQLRGAQLLQSGRAEEAAREFDRADQVIGGAVNTAPAPQRARMRRQAQQARDFARRSRSAPAGAGQRAVTLEAADAAMEMSSY